MQETERGQDEERWGIPQLSLQALLGHLMGRQVGCKAREKCVVVVVEIIQWGRGDQLFGKVPFAFILNHIHGGSH